MPRTDFAQPQADRSATANARRRTDRAPAPRSRRRRTARGRSPRRSSDPGHGCRRRWCREFASVKMPFGSRSRPAFAFGVVLSGYRGRGKPAHFLMFSLHPDTPGAREFGAAVDFHLQVRRLLLWRLDGQRRRALKQPAALLACEGCTGAGRSGFGVSSFGASGFAAGGGGAIGSGTGACAVTGTGRTAPATADSRVRATASPLSKSSALSHALARKLAMRSSSHSLITSISKAPSSRWSINCIPWPVTAHCLPIQKMSRCNAIFALRYLSRSMVLSPPI